MARNTSLKDANMKNISLSLIILSLISAPLSVTATNWDSNTTKQDNRKQSNSYPLQPKNSEIGHDNNDIDRDQKDEYPKPDGNIPESQPLDKSSLPPS
jgi:hypothetical protein